MFVRNPFVIKRQRHTQVCVLLICVALPLAGCGGRPATQSAAPTVAPVFRPESNDIRPTTGPIQPAGPPTPSDAVLASRIGDNVEAIPIFDEQLDSDWSLDESLLMRIDTASNRYIQSGRVAIEASPRTGYSSLFFTVRADARRRYNADEILGVRFWINGGSNAIGPEDLIVTVLGSNAFPYWRADDTSVEAAGRITDGGTIFDEQRIYFLGFENGIPANTWAEVIIWLDERILDPEYTYFTGLYLKNDEFFVKPFFVDDVALLIPRS